MHIYIYIHTHILFTDTGMTLQTPSSSGPKAELIN